MKNNIFDNYKNNTLTPITCDYTTELQFKAACKTAGAYELHRFFQLSPYRTLRDNLESNCLKPQLFLQISQELQLEEKLDKYPCELNSLDMERAALAKAVLSGAELLVCFNTTEGLTPTGIVWEQYLTEPTPDGDPDANETLLGAHVE